jgi:hypothetical protein
MNTSTANSAHTPTVSKGKDINLASNLSTSEKSVFVSLSEKHLWSVLMARKSPKFCEISSKFIRQYFPQSKTLPLKSKPIDAIDKILLNKKLFLLEDYAQLDPCNYIFQCSQGKDCY